MQNTADGKQVLRIEDEQSYQKLSKSMLIDKDNKPLFIVRQINPQKPDKLHEAALL